MIYRYLDNLESRGFMYFTYEKFCKDLALSDSAARSKIYRLKKKQKVISPANGLYIIVPPENKKSGCIPPEDLIPILMDYLNAKYYVGLLSAGALFGGSYEKPDRFQVVTNKRIKHSLEFGSIIIDIIYKKSLKNLPTRDFVATTGYLKVATSELIALDLFKYHNKTKGIKQITQVLLDIAPDIDADKLIFLAEQENAIYQIQRIGFILEKINMLASKDNISQIITKLQDHLNGIDRPYISLLPCKLIDTHPKCKKWKIIENTKFESDI